MIWKTVMVWETKDNMVWKTVMVREITGTGTATATATGTKSIHPDMQIVTETIMSVQI